MSDEATSDVCAAEDTCQVCGKVVSLQQFIGSGFCSIRCAKHWAAEENAAAAKRSAARLARLDEMLKVLGGSA